MKKTKHIVFAALAAFAILAIFAACSPSFEPGLDENFDRKNERTQEMYFTVSASGSPVTIQPKDGRNIPQAITITTTAAQLNTDSGQHKETLDANGYNLVINDQNKIDGVEVYILTTGVNAVGSSPATPKVKADKLFYTASVIAANQVQLLLTLKEDGIGDTILLEVDPALAVFNNGGGKGRLNTDGDKEPGEAVEDIYFYPIAVSNYSFDGVNRNATALAGVNPIMPSTKLVYSGINFASGPGTSADFRYTGGTKLEITGFPTINSDTNVTAALLDGESIKTAYKFERFDFDTKTWVPHDPTGSSWDGTGSGKLEFTFRGSELYGFIRYQVDPYKIKEAGSGVYGYVHRVSNDQSIGYGALVSGNWKTGVWSYPGTAVNHAGPTPDPIPLMLTSTGIGGDNSTTWKVTPGGVRGDYYVDVEIPDFNSGTTSVTAGSTALKTTSLKVSTNNIQVFYYEGNPSSGGRVTKLNLNDDDIIPGTNNSGNASRSFRIKMPKNFFPVPNSSSPPTSDGKIQVRMNNVQVDYFTGTGAGKVPFTNVKIFDPARADGYLRIDATTGFTP